MQCVKEQMIFTQWGCVVGRGSNGNSPVSLIKAELGVIILPEDKGINIPAATGVSRAKLESQCETVSTSPVELPRDLSSGICLDGSPAGAGSAAGACWQRETALTRGFLSFDCSLDSSRRPRGQGVWMGTPPEMVFGGRAEHCLSECQPSYTLPVCRTVPTNPVRSVV